jgi:hypothetical protein
MRYDLLLMAVGAFVVAALVARSVTLPRPTPAATAKTRIAGS